jgi:hypothetical protein
VVAFDCADFFFHHRLVDELRMPTLIKDNNGFAEYPESQRYPLTVGDRSHNRGDGQNFYRKLCLLIHGTQRADMDTTTSKT